MIKRIFIAALPCAASLLLFAVAPAQAFCVVNGSDLPFDVKAGGSIPTFYRGNVKPGETICHVPRRKDVGVMVDILQTGKISGRDLKCRLSVPADHATITVAKDCRVTVD